MTEENKDEQGTEILPEGFDPGGYGKCRAWRCECQKFTYQNGSNMCATSDCGHNYQRHALG